mmetsp:Transcript_28404/g.87897  ORF Transcript_28404/g.87897 Transcript_28404/m.87897 type:complete len:124 (+) Transcript_28404:135-506(+)
MIAACRADSDASFADSDDVFSDDSVYSNQPACNNRPKVFLNQESNFVDAHVSITRNTGDPPHQIQNLIAEMDVSRTQFRLEAREMVCNKIRFDAQSTEHFLRVRWSAIALYNNAHPSQQKFRP